MLSWKQQKKKVYNSVRVLSYMCFGCPFGSAFGKKLWGVPVFDSMEQVDVDETVLDLTSLAS